MLSDRESGKNSQTDMFFTTLCLFVNVQAANTQHHPLYTHVKKQLWNIQKCFKNMYIDKFIWIQIGPSTAIKHHSFLAKGFGLQGGVRAKKHKCLSKMMKTIKNLGCAQRQGLSKCSESYLFWKGKKGLLDVKALLPSAVRLETCSWAIQKRRRK